jgi:hypothetical protein
MLEAKEEQFLIEYYKQNQKEYDEWAEKIGNDFF